MTHKLNVVACVHVCKSGPFCWTPKSRRQADTVHTYTIQQLHDTSDTTCTTQCEQHDLALSLKSATKTFMKFTKFNRTYYLVCYILQNTLHMVYQTKIHTYRHQTDSVTPYRGHKIKRTPKEAPRTAQ